MPALYHRLAVVSPSLMAVSTSAVIILSHIELGTAQYLPLPTRSPNSSSNSYQPQDPKLIYLYPSLMAVKAAEVSNVIPAPRNTDILAQSPPMGSLELPSWVQQTAAPEDLSPSPNPLLFPTKPEEVRVQLTKPITLQQALTLARRNNRELQTAILTLERTQAALREALAAQSPTLGLQTDITRTDSASGELGSRRQQASVPPQSGQSDQSTVSTSLNGALQLNYELYTSGRRSATIRAQEEQVRFNELDVERQSEQVRLDVTNAYYDLQEADAQVEIAEASVREAERSLRDAQLLEQAGLGTRFDVLQAEVRLAQANQDLTTARSQQSIARRQLVQLLSLAQTVEVTAAEPIQVAGSWDLSLEESIILALRNRAELQQSLAQRNIGQQQQVVALSAERPQVNLFANYNVLDVFNDGVGLADGLTLGARLRWDFYDGGAARARAEQQKANIALAETQFADTRNQIRLQVEQAYFNLNASQRNIQTASVAVQQAEESLRLARLRFNAGVGTQTDVINAQTELTTARGNRLRAIVNYNRGLASLQRAISNFPSSNLFGRP
ncbi:MAG: TolC family protein [Aphanothece sp. CMT-3BRIN-NPC111]|nr:TolC family protein [Aphanothece sp. CMT-3BRIN-NPC111]